MYDENLGEYIGENGVIELTKSENKIMSLLIENKGTTITFNDIAQVIHGCNTDKYLNNNISLMIYRLRRKVHDEIKIYSRYGWGYFIR